jgi:hypothetical protein
MYKASGRTEVAVIRLFSSLSLEGWFDGEIVAKKDSFVNTAYVDGDTFPPRRARCPRE